GVLDADGVAAFGLVDGQQRPVTESAAWDHDWRSTAVTVGVDLKASVEAPQTRERIRDFARERLRGPAGADGRAVAGFDLLAHRFERRHAARRVARVDGLDRCGARRGLGGWFRF